MEDGKHASQASHIWSMLNDMSANDPSAYQKFVDKHINEGKEFMKPPEPHMCVTTLRNDHPQNTTLYLNICEWNRVPAPKSDQDPIPITGSYVYDLPGNKDNDQAIAIAFNPKVLEECGKNASMTEEQSLLIGLCLDYLEKQHSVSVSRSYSVLPYQTTHKGPTELIKNVLLSKSRKTDEEFDTELNELEKKFGPGLKNSFLNMSSGNIENSTQNQSQDNTSAFLDNIESTVKCNVKILPSEQKTNKPGLIHEVGVTKNEGDLVEPDFQVLTRENDGKPKRIVLRINLPFISSVTECEVDISPCDVKLYVPGKCRLFQKLSQRIDDENSTAKYSRKSGMLSITLPVL